MRVGSIQVPRFWQEHTLVDAVRFALEHVSRQKLCFFCCRWAGLITWLRWYLPYSFFIKGHFFLFMVNYGMIH